MYISIRINSLVLVHVLFWPPMLRHTESSSLREAELEQLHGQASLAEPVACIPCENTCIYLIHTHGHSQAHKLTQAKPLTETQNQRCSVQEEINNIVSAQDNKEFTRLLR